MQQKRKLFLLLLFIFLSRYTAFAQLGYDFKPIDIGFGFGRNTTYGDIELTKNTYAMYAHIGYNVSPFVNFIGEYQNGRLAGGDALKTVSGREFVNKYSSVVLRGQLQAGEYINYAKNPVYNALKNLYIGAGIGVVFNNIAEINRESIQVPGFITEGKDKSEELVIPVRIGYEFKIYNTYNEPNVKIDLGYQHHFMIGDNLDGYETGAYKDTFSQIFVGVKFGIGAPTSYRKPIVYQ